MDGFTTGKAGGAIQQLAPAVPKVPTEYISDAQDLARAQRLASMLTQGGLQADEGQMISGRYVAPSWTQHLGRLAQAGMGAYFANESDKKATDLAAKLREGGASQLTEVMKDINDKNYKKAYSKAITSEYPEVQGLATQLAPYVIPPKKGPMVVGKSLVDPDTKEELFRAPTEFAPHAPQMVSTDRGMMIFNPNNQSYTPATDAQGKPIMPPMDSGAKSDLRDNQKQQATIAGAIQVVKDNPTAFSYKRGVIGNVFGEPIANKLETPEATEARSYVYNIVSNVIHQRAGASQTPSELAKINRFLPTEKDGPVEIERKLKGFQTFLKDEAEGISKPTTGQPNLSANNPPPASNTNRKVVDTGEVRSGPNKGKKAYKYDDGTVEIR